MGRNTRNALAAAAAGRSVKEKHQRAARDNITVPRHLVVLPEKNIQSKHKSYFEFFENKDKRDKKLEFQVSRAIYFLSLLVVLPTAGHHRCESPSWLRVPAYRQSGTYQRLQGALEGAGCYDLDCLGTFCTTYTYS